MRCLFLYALCWLTQSLSAQTWQWSHQLGGPESQSAYAFGVSTEASVYVYGGYYGPSGIYIGEDTLHGPGGSAFLAKYGADGTLAWVSNCTSPTGVSIYNAVLDTVSSRLYVVGVYLNSCTLDTCSLSSSGSGGFLSQWDLEGHCLWARNAVVSGPDFANHFCTTGAVAVDDQGHILIGGSTTPYGPNYLAGRLVPQGTFMASYSAAGDTLWTRMLATYQGDSHLFRPIGMHASNGHLWVYNQVGILNNSDTMIVDTTVVSNLHGLGYAVFKMDPIDGSMNWFRPDGFPYAGASNMFPQRFYVDGNGDMFVTGGYGNMSVFGTDTLAAAYAGGFIAKYDSDGVLQWVHGYEATGGVNFLAMSGRVDGRLDITGWIQGSANWDGISISTNTENMLLASFSPTGECLGIEGDVGPAMGVSIKNAPDGLYLAGLFPPETPPQPPFKAITIGSNTYTTFGGRDAFLAKHALATSIAYRSVQADGLHIYANPNRGSFQVQLPDAFTHSRNLVLHVYDSTGRMVLEQQLDMRGEPAHMDVFDAVPGLYNVTVTDGHSTCSGSMVVE